GPEKSEEVEEIPTYPYVIIRTHKIDQMIRFNS
ncbi:MAG: protease complex subunit PrcB family protein, partial [Lachnospiraceae bacterium]|nr:protease complex subunit PrcB family protein [Lachnospiraceae bacterium]